MLTQNNNEVFHKKDKTELKVKNVKTEPEFRENFLTFCKCQMFQVHIIIHLDYYNVIIMLFSNFNSSLSSSLYIVRVVTQFFVFLYCKLLWRGLKFVIRKFTGRCELQRICYNNKHGARRTLKIGGSKWSLKQSLPLYILPNINVDLISFQSHL